MGEFFYLLFNDHYANLGFLLFLCFICSGIHEYAHARIAFNCGDESVIDRVTLNPLKHIGLMETILLPCFIVYLSEGQFIFGSAKPVPVNVENLRRRGIHLSAVALAGPISNILLVVATLIVMIVSKLFIDVDSFKVSLMFKVCCNFVMVNLLLGAFNLFPIPPLDGFKAIIGYFPISGRAILIIDVIGLIVLLYIMFTQPFFVEFMYVLRDDIWPMIWNCYAKFPI